MKKTNSNLKQNKRIRHVSSSSFQNRPRLNVTATFKATCNLQWLLQYEKHTARYFNRTFAKCETFARLTLALASGVVIEM